MPKSKRKSQSRSSLTRMSACAGIGSFMISLVMLMVLIGPSLGLTVVDNTPDAPTDPVFDIAVRIYANGISYTPTEFDSATVSGIITIYADVMQGSDIPSTIFMDVTPDGANSPMLSAPLQQSTYDQNSWSVEFDTTTIEDGVYWFKVKATGTNSAGDPVIIQLATFGLSMDTGRGTGTSDVNGADVDTTGVLSGILGIMALVLISLFISLVVLFGFAKIG